MKDCILLSLCILIAAVPQAHAVCTDDALSALEKHTFRLEVTVGDLPNGRNKLQQTAFRIAAPEGVSADGAVQMRDGLFTALHGVVGATSIRATRGSQRAGAPFYERYRDMVVHSYDTEADIAFLVPQDGVFPRPVSHSREEAPIDFYQPRKGDGLIYASLPAPLFDGNISVFEHRVGIPSLCALGFPQGTLAQSDHALRVRDRTVRLRDYIGANARFAWLDEYLIATDSPSIDVVALSLDGEIRGGDSGAPLVDPDGRVVAVANGGIGVNLNWAIPLGRSCYFAESRHDECIFGPPDEAFVRRVRQAEKDHVPMDGERFGSAFKGAAIVAPLPMGAIVAAPVRSEDTGDLLEIEAFARLATCDRIDASIAMRNRDPVFGGCVAAQLAVLGPDGELLIEQGEDGPFGRTCVGAALEDEAVLKLFRLVENSDESALLRLLLGIDDEDMGRLKSTRRTICDRRDIAEEACGPTDRTRADVPFVTVRDRQAASVAPSPGATFCDQDGSSRVHTLSWTYLPRRKPDGVFDLLDRLETGLAAVRDSPAAPIVFSLVAAYRGCDATPRETCLVDGVMRLVGDGVPISREEVARALSAFGECRNDTHVLDCIIGKLLLR